MFRSIHAANPDPKLLAYQYLQTLPQIAQGDANKMWIVPSEFSKALEGLSGLTGGGSKGDGDGTGPGTSGTWLTEAGSGPPVGPVGDVPDIDTSDWFDSNLPPAAVQAEVLRASDSDPDSIAAHEGMADMPRSGSLVPSVSVPKPIIPRSPLKSSTDDPGEDALATAGEDFDEPPSQPQGGPPQQQGPPQQRPE